MTTLVLDASVLLKWFLPEHPGEEHVAAALALQTAFARGQVTLLQPPHAAAEVLAVLARLRPASAADDLADLMDYRWPQREDELVYRRALRLSIDLNHHLFDTLYHALALETPGAVFVTADRRYFDKARSLGAIAWLAEFPLP